MENEKIAGVLGEISQNVQFDYEYWVCFITDKRSLLFVNTSISDIFKQYRYKNNLEKYFDYILDSIIWLYTIFSLQTGPVIPNIKVRNIKKLNKDFVGKDINNVIEEEKNKIILIKNGSQNEVIFKSFFFSYKIIINQKFKFFIKRKQFKILKNFIERGVSYEESLRC